MVSQRDDRIEASVVSKLYKPSSGVQVSRIAFFPFWVFIIRIVVLVIEEQFIIFRFAGVLSSGLYSKPKGSSSAS